MLRYGHHEGLLRLLADPTSTYTTPAGRAAWARAEFFLAATNFEFAEQVYARGNVAAARYLWGRAMYALEAYVLTITAGNP